MADLAKAPPNVLLGEGITAGDEDVSIELSGEGAETTATETGGTEEQAQAQTAVEKEASDAGWVTESEWVEQHGSSKGWKSADDFMDVRRNMMPILSKENKAMRAELEQIKREREAEKKERAELNSKFERDQLKAQLRQAREDQDWDKVDELADKILDLRVAEKVAPQPAATAPAIDPEVKRDFLEFQGRNSWLTPGTRLAKLFAVQLESVMRAGAYDSNIDAMEVAKKMLKSQFPEEFPASRRAPMAEGRGQHGNANGTTRSWSSLKPEIKAEYDKFADGWPKAQKEEALRNMPADYFRS